MENTTSDTQQSNKFIPMLGIGIVALVVVLGIGFFMLKGNSTPAVQSSESTQNEVVIPTSTAVSPIEEASEAAQANAEVKIVEVEAGSFYYKPNEIKVKKGEKVKIVLKSVSMMHNFVIDELNVQIPITKSGETGTVEFVADKVGTFTYYCSVGQHRKNGQEGKLIVE